ncbi:hypothetical protein B0H16DRAFT_1688081 [Mycena metata]|uniref:Uncharacterized protein n=1 Tax=Mycena metata TaxID=1033252 RepID=A0AAD7JEE4_9AGAR|nr:hypothetical protein B0H16DRAFT_1688081 [Mycena metata]
MHGVPLHLFSSPLTHQTPATDICSGAGRTAFNTERWQEQKGGTETYGAKAGGNLNGWCRLVFDTSDRRGTVHPAPGDSRAQLLQYVWLGVFDRSIMHIAIVTPALLEDLRFGELKWKDGLESFGRT